MPQLIKQFARFLIVGFTAFAIDYSLLMLLTQMYHMNAIVAAACSFSISLTFNYLASMHFVYKSRDDISRKQEMLMFLSLSLIGMFINEIIICIGTSTFGTDPISITGTKIVSTAVVMLWNFFSRKKFLDSSQNLDNFHVINHNCSTNNQDN